MATLQVTTTRPGILHFQYGENKNYQTFDLAATGKESTNGLKAATSLYGSKTPYFVIPRTKLKNGETRKAFKAKHRFGLAKVAAWVVAVDSESDE